MSPHGCGANYMPIRSEWPSRRAHLFKNLSAQTKTELESSLEWTVLRSGETLFREGDAGEALYLVVSGRVRLIQNQRCPHGIPGAAAERCWGNWGREIHWGRWLCSHTSHAPQQRMRSAILNSRAWTANPSIGSWLPIPRKCWGCLWGRWPSVFANRTAEESQQGRSPVSIAVLVRSPLGREFANQLAKALSAFGYASSES